MLELHSLAHFGELTLVTKAGCLLDIACLHYHIKQVKFHDSILPVAAVGYQSNRFPTILVNNSLQQPCNCYQVFNRNITNWHY